MLRSASDSAHSAGTDSGEWASSSWRDGFPLANGYRVKLLNIAGPLTIGLPEAQLRRDARRLHELPRPQARDPFLNSRAENSSHVAFFADLGHSTPRHLEFFNCGRGTRFLDPNFTLRLPQPVTPNSGSMVAPFATAVWNSPSMASSVVGPPESSVRG